MAIQLTYTEKDVEDLLENGCPFFLGLKFIKRQFRTPVGIIDVIARHPERKNVFYVIEIKKDLVDSSAYVQVLKYTKWLNHERSKEGGRIFIPLLIGNNISQDLYHVCEFFDRDSHYDIDSYHKVLYRLFNFSPYRGVLFTYSNTAQGEAYNALEYRHNHIEQLREQKEVNEYHYQQEIAAQFEREFPHLALVKKDEDAA